MENKIPCSFEYGSDECDICDCWISDCEYKHLLNKTFPLSWGIDPIQAMEKFKEFLTPEQREEITKFYGNKDDSRFRDIDTTDLQQDEDYEYNL